LENKTILDIDKGRGEVIRVEVGEFKGKKLLHLRIWYTSDSGELLPTKKGVALSIEQFEAFKNVLPQVEEALKTP